MTVNIDHLREALSELDEALQSHDLSPELRKTLADELAVIRSELDRAEPDHAALKNWGKSAKHSLDALVARLGAPGLQSTLTTLWAGLGV